MRQRNFTVEVLGEGLQVHVRGINVVVDIVERFMSDVAVGDHHRVQSVACAAWQMSITYSPQIVGSLYVNAIESQPCRIASRRNIFRQGHERGTDLIRMSISKCPSSGRRSSPCCSRPCPDGKDARARAENGSAASSRWDRSATRREAVTEAVKLARPGSRE